MLAKGREKRPGEQTQFFPDRSYVLALHFRATIPGALSTSMYSTSGLARVKNVNGEIEAPMELTPSGFVPFSGSPGVFDVRFEKSNLTEYWDLFPVAQDQSEFLFQVFPFSGTPPSSATPELSFRIVLKNGTIIVNGASPQPGTACFNLKKNFTGSIGSGSRVNLQLTAQNTALAGSEQYERIGKTLWLRGSSDTLGNFTLEERYPEDQVTGVFKGKFSESCQIMTGYFSKPDGSRLQPFEFREVGRPARQGKDQSDSEQ